MTERSAQHLDWITLVELHEGLLDAEEEMLHREHIASCDRCRELHGRLSEVTSDEDFGEDVPETVAAMDHLGLSMEDLPPAPDDIRAMSLALLDEPTMGVAEPPAEIASPSTRHLSEFYQRLVRVSASLLQFAANPRWQFWKQPDSPEQALDTLIKTLELIDFLDRKPEVLGKRLINAQVKYDLLVSAAPLMEALGRRQEAAELRLSAVFLSRELGLVQEEGRLLREVGNAYFETGDYKRSLSNFRRALTIANAHRDDVEKYQNIRNIGCVQSRLGEAANAVESFQEAIRLARDTKQMDELSADLQNLSIGYRKLGDFVRALEVCEEALDLQRDTGDRLSIAFSLITKSNILAEMCEHGSSLQACREALALFREEKDQRRVSVCLLNIANSLNELGRHEEALPYCEDSLEIKETLQDHAGIVYVLHELGRSLRELGRIEDALGCHLRAHSLATRLEGGEIVALTKHQLAMTYLAAENLGKALEHGMAALGLAQESDADKLVLEICLTLAQLHQRQGDTAKMRNVHGIGAKACQRLSQQSRTPGNERWLAKTLPGYTLFVHDFDLFRKQLRVTA